MFRRIILTAFLFLQGVGSPATAADLTYYDAESAFRQSGDLGTRMGHLIKLMEILRILNEPGYVPDGVFTFPEGVAQIPDQRLRVQVEGAANHNLERELLKAYGSLMALELRLDGALEKEKAMLTKVERLQAKVTLGLANPREVELASADTTMLQMETTRLRTILRRAGPLLQRTLGLPEDPGVRFFDSDFMAPLGAEVSLRTPEYHIEEAGSIFGGARLIRFLARAARPSSGYRVTTGTPYFVFTGIGLTTGVVMRFNSAENASTRISQMQERIEHNLTGIVYAEYLSLQAAISRVKSANARLLIAGQQLATLDTRLERGLITLEEWAAQKKEFIDYRTGSLIAKLEYNIARELFGDLTGTYL